MMMVNPPQTAINDLVSLYRSGDLKSVERNCNKLLLSYPQSLPVFNLLGASLQGQGRLDQAVEVFNKEIRVNPEYAAAYYNRGIVLHALGRLDEAVESYDKAISLNPDYVDAYSNRGNALKELGDLYGAIESYNRAVLLRPDYAEAYSNRGNAQRDLGQTHEAIISYEKSIMIKSDYAEAYINYGLALKDLGKLEDAVDKYNTAIMLNPKIAEAYSNCGVALHDLGRMQDAIDSYNKAIQINPGYAEAYTNLGNVLTSIGRLEEAVENYHKAIRLNPDLAEAYSNYGIALRDLGELDRAVQMMQVSVEKGPENINSSDSLIDLLNYYVPNTEDNCSYVRVQKFLQSINTDIPYNSLITDEAVRELYEQYDNVVAESDLEIKTSYSQLYRGNVTDLRCWRHKIVFDKFNIIPEYCFECYKVTLYPETVLDLFKVFILFSNIQLPADNMRKCIVELRSEISGAYKCFIYCTSLSEASTVMAGIRVMVDNCISSEMPIVVKRGCSEYENSYQGYGDVVGNISDKISYNEKWREHEVYVDNILINESKHNPNNFTFNHKGITLLDGLVMCNWLAYAESIGDSSYKKISESNHVCFTGWLKDMFDKRPSFTQLKNCRGS